MASNTAFVVGIDAYARDPLSTPARDAEKIAELLQNDGTSDPDRQYTVKPVVVRARHDIDGTRASIRDHLSRQVLAARNGNFVFYFSGHGRKTAFGYELVAQDEGGISMDEVITLIETAPLKQAVIILDCCHSAGMGDIGLVQGNDTTGPMRFQRAIIRENAVVISAARADQQAQGAGSVEDEFSAFTKHLVAGLEGAAADLSGEVHAHALFEYAASMFSSGGQQPVFKGHYAELEPLRRVQREMPLTKLRRLKVFFPDGIDEVDAASLTVDDALRELRRYGYVACDADDSLEAIAAAGGKLRLTRAGRRVRQLDLAGEL